jgi:hypothetical protein
VPKWSRHSCPSAIGSFNGLTSARGYFAIFFLTRKGLFSIHAEQYTPPDLIVTCFSSRHGAGEWSFFPPDKLLVDSGPIAGSPEETFPGFVVILPSAIQFSIFFRFCSRDFGKTPRSSGMLPHLSPMVVSVFDPGLPGLPCCEWRRHCRQFL